MLQYERINLLEGFHLQMPYDPEQHFKLIIQNNMPDVFASGRLCMGNQN